MRKKKTEQPVAGKEVSEEALDLVIESPEIPKEEVAIEAAVEGAGENEVTLSDGEAVETSTQSADVQLELDVNAAIEIPEPPIAKTITLKGVVLKGTDPQLKGSHTIHLGSRIVSFHNGKADVTAEIEQALRNSGYIE